MQSKNAETQSRKCKNPIGAAFLGLIFGPIGLWYVSGSLALKAIGIFIAAFVLAIISDNAIVPKFVRGGVPYTMLTLTFIIAPISCAVVGFRKAKQTERPT